MKISTINYSPPLRIKISRLINNYRKHQCKPFINHLSSFNQKAIDYSFSKPYEKKQVIKSRNISFGPIIPWDIHYIPTEQFSANYDQLAQEFRKELSLPQIDLITNNKAFYLKEKELRDNLTFLPEDPLYVILNKEDQQKPMSKIGTLPNNESLLSRNKSNFLFAEKSIKSQISLDKEKRMESYMTQKNRQNQINKLYQQTKEEIASLIYNKKKDKMHKSSLLITQNHQVFSRNMMFLGNESKRYDNIMNLKKSPCLQSNIKLPQIIYSPTVSNKNIPKMNINKKKKKKLCLITSPSCAIDYNKKIAEDKWLWNYNQELKSILKEKELEKEHSSNKNQIFKYSHKS